MKSEKWELIKFAIKLALRSVPRLYVAPYVGAVRYTLQELDRMDAEFDEYAEQLGQRAENAVTPATSAQPR